MRRLILVLNILIGSSLLGQSTEILAASADVKENKNNHQRGHSSRSRGRSKDPQLAPVKQKSLQNPGDVWERIRSGMKIPRPLQVETFPEKTVLNNNELQESSVIQTSHHTRIWLNPDTINSSDARIGVAPTFPVRPLSERILARQKLRLPITASAPMHNYTPYGRLKLNVTLSSRIRNNAALSEHSIASKNVNLDENAAALVRLHSRIDFHPKLQRLDFKIPTEPLIRAPRHWQNPSKRKLQVNQ
jgi:hypothetical protein